MSVRRFLVLSAASAAVCLSAAPALAHSAGQPVQPLPGAAPGASVSEASVSADATGAPAETAPSSTMCPSGAVAPPVIPVFVDDLDRLAELTRGDRFAFQEAQTVIARRGRIRNGAVLAALGGAGLALFAGMMRVSDGRWTDGSVGLAIGGGALVAAAALGALLVWPGRTDRLAIINKWNARHPERPIFP